MAALRKSLSGPMNGGLQPQASELLATHSISELRSLVQTLQSECGSKKSELQMMVGSKYHDFIESADAISSMYNASDAVGRNISDLSSLGKQVIEKSLALLDAKLPQSVVNSAAQSIYLKSDLSATKFWECVGSCNVFTAAEVLVTSGVLRSLLTGQGGMANTWLSDSFSNNDPMWDRFRVHVTSCSLADSLHVSLHLMTPLRLVLLEDAYFFLLLANEKSVSLSAQNSSKAVACSATGPQASPRQLAEALAALAAVRAFSVGDNCAELDDVDLSVLSSSLDPSILAASYASFMRVTGNDENKLSKPGGKPEVLIDMLKLYLDGATERIFSAVEGMGADARERIDESHDVWILYVGKLLNAIVTLQRSILDVYLIFFHHQSLRNSTLIETCCSDLAGSVVARLNALLTESYADDQPTSAQATFSLRSGGHPLAYGSLNRSEDSRRLLHDVWTQWMYGKRGTDAMVQPVSSTLFESMSHRGGATAVLSNACLFCLQLIKASPATGGDVSTLQNKVRVACASADVVSLIVMPEDYGFTPDINYGTDGRNNNSLSSMKSRNLQRVHRTSSNTGFGAVNGLGAGDSSADSMSPKETDVDPKLSAWRSELWISANKTLLLSYKPATIAATGGSSKSAPTKHSSNHHDVLFARTASSPGNLLWSKVFRKPFLHQVESALHASSVSGLYRVQQRMMRALYCVGVVVNLVSSPRSLGLEDDGTSTECIMTIKPVVVPATRLSRTRQTARMQCSSVDVYHLAEELRLCLNRELIDLRTGIQLSEDENESEEAGANSNVTDKESSHSLARSVQIYSSQLIGQVATLTRCMAEACRAASYSSSLEGGYCKVWDSAVCDSMLLLGRFAWLLKVNGSFLTTSLSYSIPGAKPSNNSANAVGSALDISDDESDENRHGDMTYYTSYDQLQSAFDIADSDGDGLITYAEAIEALQALCVGNDGENAEHQALSQCLWPDASDTTTGTNINKLTEYVLTSSPYAGNSRISAVIMVDVIRFSLLEFKLLCGKYVPVNAQVKVALRMLHSALDATIQLTHKTWSGSVIASGHPILRCSLHHFYNRENYVLATSAVKDSWASYRIDGGSDEEESSMSLPTIPSVAVTEFLRNLISHVNTKLTSVDTFQTFFSCRNNAAIERNILTGNDDESVPHASIGCLAEYVSTDLMTSAAISVAKIFSDLLISMQQKHSGDAEMGDDVLMIQLLFDLLVVQRTLLMSSDTAVDVSEAKKQIKACIAKCQDAIDPITIHLGLSLIEGAVNEFCSKRRLLTNFPVVDNKALAGDSLPKTVPARQVFSISSGKDDNKQHRFGVFPLPSMQPVSSIRASFHTDDDEKSSPGKADKNTAAIAKPNRNATSSSSTMLNSISGLTSYLTRGSNSSAGLSNAEIS